MSKTIKLKKGLDIKLLGKAKNEIVELPSSETYALKPTDFHGLNPKLAAKPGDKVKIGSPLFFDKNRPDIMFTSPVSGTVTDVVRGDRRKILEVIVQNDGQEQKEQFTQGNPLSMPLEEIKSNILKSGLWPMVKQRPYNIIANPTDTPKAIFISGFDSSPLAPDYSFILKEQTSSFQVGIDALSKLTTSKVNLSICEKNTCEAMSNVKGANIYKFSGAHPAGNVGVQIHHIDPINKGEVVWTVNAQDVAAIGKLFEQGTLDPTKLVAVTGPKVMAPKYFSARIGTPIAKMIEDNIASGENRIVSGNVLTGETITEKGFLGFYDSQITVLEEGNNAEFLGWGTPGFGKFSMSRTFFSWLTPNKEYDIDTNMRGGERPFVVTGQYDQVLPMDILPVHLLKAIIIGDIDKMEQLGIYEVAEEDFALCEVVCTSKTPVQEIIRNGMDMIHKEFS